MDLDKTRHSDQLPATTVSHVFGFNLLNISIDLDLVEELRDEETLKDERRRRSEAVGPVTWRCTGQTGGGSGSLSCRGTWTGVNMTRSFSSEKKE